MKTVVTAVVLLRASAALAHPLDTLGPGQWYEVPGSHVEEQFPTPRPAGNTGPSAVIDAWGGGAFDSVHGRLLLWGGGHNDYGGNEVYAFDVASLKWSRAWGPEPVVTDIPGTCSSTYTGGTPSARHTYGGLVFIPTTGRLWASGGFRFCGNTGADTVTWLFDPTAQKWSQGANALEAVGTPSAAWDPTGKRVLYQAQNLLQAYDPATNQYAKIGDVDGGFWATAHSAVDVEHNLFLAVTNGKLRVWNLATRTFTSDQPTTGGARAMTGVPGVEWDPTLKRVVTWPGGSSVYSLDVEHWTWFEHAPSGATTPTAPAAAGTYGRFRYMPDRNAYVLVNKTSENVFFYKLTTGTGTPVPPPADAGAVDAPVGDASGPGDAPVPPVADAALGDRGDAAVSADAPPADAGALAAPDSAGSPDSKPGSAGCGCALGGPPGPSGLAAGLALFALLVTRRRRTSER
jgi:MYXO-CTERM domain-containing protein